jgi:hypothetical protein
MLSAPAAAIANASYEGTVTKHAGGAPMEHVGVEVYGVEGGKYVDLREETTGAGGTWHIVVTTVPAGVTSTYVRFHYPGYQTGWYSGGFSAALATPIAWEPNGTHTLLDASMYPAAKIEGKVTDAVTGEPVSGSKIEALTPDGSVQAGNPAISNAKGEYTITMEDLPPGGNVKVQFLTEGPYFLNQYYGGEFAFAEASTLGVAPTATSSNVNLALVHAGSITGRITDALTGVGLEKVYVHVYDAAGQQIAGVTNGLTGGNYTVRVPGVGVYTLGFIDGSSSPVYTTQYYNGKATLACADQVAVAGGQTLANINAAMTTSAAMLGTCSPGGGGAGNGGGGASGGGAGGGGGGQGSGGNGGSPPVTAPQIIVLLNSVIAPSGKAASIGAILKAGGFAYAFQALEAGVAEIDWYQVPPGAHVANRKPKPVLVASGRLSFASAGTQTLKVKLTAAGKNLLKHAKRTHAKALHLTSKATFTPTGKPAVTATKTFTVKH